MRYQNCSSKDGVTAQLTRDALEHIDGFDASDYNESDWYGNPAQDMTNGMDRNWTNHIAPENAVQLIRSYDDLSEGVARVALDTEATCYEKAPESSDMTDRAFIGLVQAVAGRFGYGATGERFFAENVHTLPAKAGDEDSGVDVRAGFGVTAQVKTMEKYRNKSKKEADLLVWVQPGDEWTWEVRKA